LTRSAIHLAALTVLASAASAQSLLSDETCAKLAAFLPQAHAARLDATIAAVKPEITYAFRFYAGYSVAIPVKQFTASPASVAVLARVVPRDGSHSPVCFSQTESFEPRSSMAAARDLLMEGGFFLGAGSYAMDVAVADPQGRLYRKHIVLTAAARGSRRHIHFDLAPGVIQPIPRMSWTPHPHAASSLPRQLTVLFHAASLYGSRTSLEITDLAQLLGSLSTVLSDSNFDQIRIVAFNIDQQRELFRQDSLDVPGFQKMIETLLPLRLWTVSAASLHPETPVLDALLRAELSASQGPARTVLLLGPPVYDDQLQVSTFSCDSSHPRFVYFQHRVDRALVNMLSPIPERPRELSDKLERLVHSCNGEVYRIHNPADLAAAIDKFNGSVQN